MLEEKYGDKIGNFGGIDMDVVCRNSKEEIREYYRERYQKRKREAMMC